MGSKAKMRPGNTKNGRNLCALRWLKQTKRSGTTDEFNAYYGTLTSDQLGNDALLFSRMQVVPTPHACNTNYHHNYSVKNKTRTYYGGMPSHIQVAEHQFVELELALQRIDLIVSATNSRLYEIAQARSSTERDKSWQFLTLLTTREVWDAFVIVALLDHQQMQGGRLQVPHDGDQKDRYTAAMGARTEQIITHGQEELPHACYGCMRVFTSPDGLLPSTEVIVTDGVIVGRPCRAIPRCKNPLMTHRCRYCLEHQTLESICAVEGCSQVVTRDPQTGKLLKACDDPFHTKMEAANTESSRSGKSRTQRNKTAKFNDVMESSMHDLTNGVKSIPLQDADEWYEREVATGAVRLVQASMTTSTGVSDLAPNEPSNCDNSVRSGKDAPVKLKAVFRRHRANNEQLYWLAMRNLRNSDARVVFSRANTQRFRDQELKIYNAERTAIAARQNLTQAQWRSSEWENRAKEYESLTRWSKLMLNLMRGIPLQTFNWKNFKEAEGHFVKDREQKLHDQVANFEAQVARLESDLSKAKATPTPSIASSYTKIGHTELPSPPDSRSSTVFSGDRSSTPVAQMNGSHRPRSDPPHQSSPSVRDSMRAPRRFPHLAYAAVPATPKSRRLISSYRPQSVVSLTSQCSSRSVASRRQVHFQSYRMTTAVTRNSFNTICTCSTS
ncbi:uncharacterized protein F5891DRAFT_1204281 [Suillus fuscotomentosus]|uniref:Uncharacterized protein n=1 Tax=Suillus fuscotomentosus TaxID=1912939 RepID=A0AAD4HBI9_9AGAM|nr:uncharacterized protein F5891DRAFT_1204281 [Suillus fuscotomentosus]KAG1881012.1 hypothetical protein F5891DRAFT_1204281 [Suillus fuscotomentosus]